MLAACTSQPGAVRLPGGDQGHFPVPRMAPAEELPVLVRYRKRDYAVVGCGDHKNGLFGVFFLFFSLVEIEIEHVRFSA